jgi:hypothetical protein
MKSNSIKNIVFISLIFSLLLLSINEMFGGNGGSGYSRYGIGDIRYFISSRTAGMGGSGLADLSNNSIDHINPADWTQLSRTRYSLSVLYEGYSTTDGIKSGYFSGSSFNGILISIPVMPSEGIVLSTGLIPYSRINYNVISPVSSSDVNYDVQYIGDGGISQAYLGVSATLANDIHIGSKLNYYLGNLNYSTRQLFGASNYSEVLRSLELSGFGVTFGAIYSGLNKAIGIPNTKMLTIGAVFTTTSYLTANEEKFYTYRVPSLVTRDTTISYDTRIRLPYSFGIGMSYLSERFLLALDMYYQNWKQFTIGGNTMQELRDSYRLSTGGEFLPKRDQSAPFFQRMPYRLGFFFNSSYYRLKGNPINEIGITGGFGIPIFSDTRIDIGAEYSFRGTTDQHLQKDKILRLSFTLSGGEIWFVRPEQE